mgnify:CR=1 FL=1
MSKYLLNKSLTKTPMTCILKVHWSRCKMSMPIDRKAMWEKVEIDGPWIKCRPKESYLVVKEQLSLAIHRLCVNHMTSNLWGDTIHQVIEHKVLIVIPNNFIKKLKRKSELVPENPVKYENRKMDKLSRKPPTFTETILLTCRITVRNE